MKKTLEEWERLKGCIVIGDVDLTEEMEEKDFSLLPSKGVDWDFRLQWLHDNGYEATRKNVGDPDLPVVQKKGKK